MPYVPPAYRYAQRRIGTRLHEDISSLLQTDFPDTALEKSEVPPPSPNTSSPWVVYSIMKKEVMLGTVTFRAEPLYVGWHIDGSLPSLTEKLRADYSLLPLATRMEEYAREYESLRAHGLLDGLLQ